MVKSFPLEILPTSKCECCDSREIVGIVGDIQECDSVNGWRTWKAFGGPHFFCNVHDRPSLQYMQDGTIRIGAVYAA